MVAKSRKIPRSFDQLLISVQGATIAYRSTNNNSDQLPNENYTERWATNDRANASIR